MTIHEALEQRELGAVIKHTHIFDIYESHLSHLQNEKLTILEIGVYNGGSLYMWRNYFPNAKIVGVDIDPFCKRWENKQKNIFIELGDQANPEFLKQINEQYGPFDIIIDDGGHENHQIITSLKTLFPLLNTNGTYIVEDTFHAYWPEYSCDTNKSTQMIESNGLPSEQIDLNPITKVYNRTETCMEYLKSLCDKVNCWAYKSIGETPNEAKYMLDNSEMDAFDKGLYSIHFYDGMVILNKFPRKECKSYGTSKWYEHVAPIPQL